MKIAHLSDIHFGRIADLHILDALWEDVEAAAVDLVAVSGDLTQRAYRHQYRAAVGFLNRFTAPQVVVPGNHDVFPWWRPFARIFNPVARFQDYFGESLVRSVEFPGVALLGVNSAHGLTVKGGKIKPAVHRAIGAYFSAIPADTFKVLMLHHHLVFVNALSPHDISIAGPQTYQTAVDVGVDMILCGHLHVSHVGLSHVESLDSKNKSVPVIASAGTATSDRGRRSNRHRNLYNLIEIYPDCFIINERAYAPGKKAFVKEKASSFDRGSSRKGTIMAN